MPNNSTRSWTKPVPLPPATLIVVRGFASSGIPPRYRRPSATLAQRAILPTGPTCPGRRFHGDAWAEARSLLPPITDHIGSCLHRHPEVAEKDEETGLPRWVAPKIRLRSSTAPITGCPSSTWPARSKSTSGRHSLRTTRWIRCRTLLPG